MPQNRDSAPAGSEGPGTGGDPSELWWGRAEEFLGSINGEAIRRGIDVEVVFGERLRERRAELATGEGPGHAGGDATAPTPAATQEDWIRRVFASPKSPPALPLDWTRAGTPSRRRVPPPPPRSPMPPPPNAAPARVPLRSRVPPPPGTRSMPLPPRPTGSPGVGWGGATGPPPRPWWRSSGPTQTAEPAAPEPEKPLEVEQREALDHLLAHRGEGADVIAPALKLFGPVRFHGTKYHVRRLTAWPTFVYGYAGRPTDPRDLPRKFDAVCAGRGIVNAPDSKQWSLAGEHEAPPARKAGFLENLPGIEDVLIARATRALGGREGAGL